MHPERVAAKEWNQQTGHALLEEKEDERSDSTTSYFAFFPLTFSVFLFLFFSCIVRTRPPV